MTEDIPFEKLIEALESPTVSKNSQNLMQMLQEAQAFVSEVNKISKTLDETLSLGQKYGLPIDRLVAGLCKKINIDLYTPLAKDPVVNQARSPLHQNVMERLNLLNEAQLITFLADVEQMEKEKQQQQKKKLKAHETRSEA